MEELVKEKEKELERVEEQGCALVQNKTDEACAIVMETLQGVNHTWANLDHLVISLFFFVYFLLPGLDRVRPIACPSLSCSDFGLILQFTGCRCMFLISPSTDWAAKDQLEVSAGPVDSIQTRFRGDQWLPDGGKVLCVSFPPPHRLTGGCSSASAKSAGILR